MTIPYYTAETLIDTDPSELKTLIKQGKAGRYMAESVQHSMEHRGPPEMVGDEIIPPRETEAMEKANTVTWSQLSASEQNALIEQMEDLMATLEQQGELDTDLHSYTEQTMNAISCELPKKYS